MDLVAQLGKNDDFDSIITSSHNRFMKIILIFLFFLTPLVSHSAWTVRYSLFYYSWEDDVDNYTASRMNNSLFIGASFDKDQQIFLGPSYQIWSKAHKPNASSTESDLSLTEFGARLVYFFDRAWRWKFSATYNFASSGDRTVSGASQEVDGSGYQLSLGYSLPVNRNFYVGASLNYHSVGIESSTVNNTKSNVTQTYTTLYPMLEFALRFK